MMAAPLLKLNTFKSKMLYQAWMLEIRRSRGGNGMAGRQRKEKAGRNIFFVQPLLKLNTFKSKIFWRASTTSPAT